jgi:alkylation response protein AidB-like acyl-CoA dehydrogenase
MTERPPGSEVGRRETIAVYSPLTEPTNFDDVDELGPWIIDGYKYITSATDADMTILLARTASGLSAFYAPTRLPNGDRNGIKVVRLKKSTGTMALPTAELELNGMRAWLIGAEGDGIREISTVLNVSRIHNSVTAVSFMRRGLAIAKVCYCNLKLL